MIQSLLHIRKFLELNFYFHHNCSQYLLKTLHICLMTGVSGVFVTTCHLSVLLTLAETDKLTAACGAASAAPGRLVRSLLNVTGLVWSLWDNDCNESYHSFMLIIYSYKRI